MLVSPSWNSIIGKTNCFKSKVEFCIRELASPLKLRFGTESLALTSTRQYENFRIISQDLGFPAMPEAEFLSGNNWKQVEIFVHHFESTTDYVKYLGFFESTVVELELRSVRSFARIIKTNATFRFPCLTSLKIFNSTSSTVEPFMGLPASLQTLSLVNIKKSASSQSIPLIKMIPSLILSQTNLTYLELNEPLVDIVFNTSDRLLIMTNLKTLIIEEPVSAEACRNVNKFITRNSKTLEIIQLNNWSNSSTFYYIASLVENLQEFHQNCHRKTIKFGEISQALKKMTSLKSLKKLTLTFSCAEIPLKWLKPALTASSKLTSLMLHPVSQLLSCFINTNMKHLEHQKTPRREEVTVWMEVGSVAYNDFIMDEGSEDSESSEAMTDVSFNSSQFTDSGEDDEDDESSYPVSSDWINFISLNYKKEI